VVEIELKGRSQVIEKRLV